MNSTAVNRIGFWSGICLVSLGLIYLGLIAVMMVSGSGFPPTEPYQSMFNILVIVTAVFMVVFWSAIHQAAPAESKFYSLVSLAMIVIFATLTSINRYVGLTVVRQSIASGNTNGLEWFLPYGWPSVMLALEMLGWGFFFGLACLCLAPVFKEGKLERTISWIMIVNGLFSLLAAIGQLIGTSSLDFSPFTLAGVVAWGPGLSAATALITIWFKKSKMGIH